jgi:phenylacetate-CoA ligase
MNFVPKMKLFLMALPPCLGKAMSLVPYEWRPVFGKIYRKRIAEMETFSKMSDDQKQSFFFEKIRWIVEYAYNNVPFYEKLYQQVGFKPEHLKSFDDLQHIPVVTKAMLAMCDIERRSTKVSGRYVVNTGGSSGSPLSFYIPSSAIGHEWSHMHRIWGTIGYTQSSLKLGFGGGNMHQKTVSYDALRHQFAVNIYHPNKEISQALRLVLRKRKIEFLHGYPSAIYDFASYCEAEDQELSEMLAKNLKGAFLSSEYPAPHFRDKIESVFKIPTISFYGHTERVVLAWEKDQKFLFSPLQTYGFAEAIKDGFSGVLKLAGTSYYNTASPFIRYDTGDEISVTKSSNSILEEFKIEGGREGDYILDKNNKSISLTGLVFGRHHRIFETARFVQIGQKEPGKAVFFITIQKSILPPEEYQNWFDLSDIQIDFEFRQIDAPILSKRGKALLNVNNSEQFLKESGGSGLR